METQDIKKVIENEDVKLSAEAIKKIFYLQHGFQLSSKGKDCELNFRNESVYSEIELINESLHFLIDLSKEDEKREKDILNVLWTLHDYKRLLDALKCPEKN